MGSQQRRIVCAALLGRHGKVLVGIRHYSADMHEQLDYRADRQQFMNLPDENQGFVDQHGNFISRADAYKLANAAGQIVHPDRCGRGLDEEGNEVMKLYSEGLY